MTQPPLPGELASHLLVAVSEALYLTTVEGRICSWLPSAEALFGYPAAQAVGADAVDLLAESADRQALRSTLAEAAGTGYAFAQLTRKHHSGNLLTTRMRIRRVAPQGANGPWLAIAEQDLSDQRRTEEQLFSQLQASEQARQLLGSVLDSARDIGIIAAEADGRISLWSSGAERLFACRRADICGPDGAAFLARLTAPDEMPLSKVFERAMVQGSYENDFMARTRGQRPFPANITARPRYNRFGEPSGVIAVVQDLTLRVEILSERDEALAEARISREAALAAARAKAEFLANMSHEIRTPMNAVLGMLQLMMRTALDRKQRDYASKAESAASDLLHIIDDILDFSKIDAGKLRLESEPFGVDRLLKDIGVILSANVGAKLVEILFQVDPGLPTRMVGDAHRLKQVLINLCGNALKFTEQGEVVLSVRRVSASDGEDLAEFSVRDTGIGMSAQRQERLFKAFSQAEAGTTRRFGGTGLGLVICQRLVRLMGGEISLQSEPGVGSTFSFRIPLRAAEGECDLPARRQTLAELANLHVLIVDDNALAREIVSEIALALGWRVDLAADGNEAMQRVRECQERGESYDIAFVDWAMPGMNGWETIRNMSALADAPSTAVIMVTAHTREAMEQQRSADRQLVADYLVKPITASDLFDAVANALAAPQAKPEAAAAAARLAGLTILVVEDNPNNQQIALELLQQEGAEVALADSGDTGIEALRAAPDRFDAVLMDIQMPGMDGYTATRKIRSELGMKALPILAVTANVMPTDLEASADAGMDGHIAKPYHVETLVDGLLEHCGREAVARRESPPPESSELPPSPPGFDFVGAFARLGQNRKLYADQARSFETRVLSDLARTREFISQDDFDSAARELHTLRGLAATLGAKSLAGQFKQLETAARDAEWPDAVAQQIALAQTLAEEAGRELAALARILEVPTPAAPGGEADRERAASLMPELESLIEHSNMRALTLFAELRECLDSRFTAQLDPLGVALNELDFQAAMPQLQALRSRLR